MTTLHRSRPGAILAALRKHSQTTAQLARRIKGDRYDVSRAVAHLRERGFVIHGNRTTDEFGMRDESRYELLFDPENPTTRHCIVTGCHTKLNHLNPGYTFLGDGPFCMRHLEQVASWELDTIIAGLLEQKSYEQLTCL